MRKIISYFLIFIGTSLLLVSSSDNLMKNIIAKRSALNGLFGIHHSDAGDLVSMSYLDNVKRFEEPFDYTFARPTDTAAGRNIDLYIYGDSYVDPIPGTAFGSINSYHFSRRSYNDLIYTLDPNKKNILVIEYAERFVRGELSNSDIYDHVKKAIPGGAFLWSATPRILYAKILGFEIFGRDVERNLELNLFGYRFCDDIKLTKASLTYYLFKRAIGDVVVSQDGSRLFLKQTMTPNDISSSYNPFDEKEIQKMIANINAVYDHYKAEGFDEVYLSIIPNPVTILQPSHYNGLIPQLQRPGVLNGTRIIDVYSIYSQDANPQKFFRIGDTHWSDNGMQAWLKVVNTELKKQSLQIGSRKN